MMQTFRIALVAVACQLVQGQECSVDQPCADLAALQRFVQYENPELFAPIHEACGTAMNDFTVLVVQGECSTEISTAPGCECAAECTTKMDDVITQVCKDSIVEIVCENASLIETKAQINIRSLFLHLMNDCTTLKAGTCSAEVPDFDATVCEAVAGFPAEGPDAVNSTVRCTPGLFEDDAVAPEPASAEGEATPATPSESSSEESEADDEIADRDTETGTSKAASLAVPASLALLFSALLAVV